jgi:signal transduction histidine kinase/ActR/RegA family two-component response regulator
MVVPDTTLDKRFVCNPLVTAENGLRFYAGALLKDPSGLPIGTVCVLDTKPRPEGISDHQRRVLQVMARQVMTQLELRRALRLRDERAADIEREAGERLAAQAALSESKDRYQSLFNSLDVGFCVIEMKYDRDGAPVDYKFVEINPAFAGETGLTEAQGKWMRELAPEHEQHWFDIYGEVARTGNAVRFEQVAGALDRWFDVHAFRIGTPEQHQVAVLFNDDTKRRKAEVALRELNETLDARVSEAVAEREQAQDALRQSQKVEAIGQLTGGVAHDFNNLLTVIRGSVDLLRMKDLPDAKRARYIDAIGETADRAAKLTSQLLAFARRQSLTPVLFDAGQSLREVADMVSTLTGGRVALDLRTPDEAYYITADRSQFDTAIVNMAINARDAMDGAGRLTIATGPVSGIPAIRADAPVAGDFIAVTVTDTGHGISDDNLDRIFEPFFTSKGVGEGTGLGLSQVIGFAKQSGGDIRAESVVGQGSTFTLYLPRAYPGETADAVEEADDTLVDGAGVCVLIVEDNPQVGAFATQALQELGYDSVLASDASAALAELEKDCDRFHIVFSDVVMPGMNGIELGEEIRRRHPHVPVLLTSGYSHVLAQNGKHGFQLLHKPYSVEQLSRILRKALRWQKSAIAKERA